MAQITDPPEEMFRHKDEWKVVAVKILEFFGCDETYEGIGRCMDAWKRSPRVDEGEMIDALGFLLGDLCIAEHGGRWVMVSDQWGTTPALQRCEGPYVSYVLDSVSKRLRDDSECWREIPSVAPPHPRCSPRLVRWTGAGYRPAPPSPPASYRA